MKYKYANKDHLLALARQGEKAGFNQQVNWDRLYDMMDDEGTNIITFHMLHDEHVRTIWYLKLRNTDKPFEAVVDIPLEGFATLPETEAEDVKAN